MWDFWSKLLDQGGVAALIVAVMGMIFTQTVRTLWKVNQDLHKQLLESHERFQARLVTVQEQRVSDTQEITERVVLHVERVGNDVGRLTNAIHTFAGTPRG